MRITTLIIVFVLLPACGQKGPLYLPQYQETEVSTGVQEAKGLEITDNWKQTLTQQEK
jgi:predicted small lipoprotein YifL